MIYGYTAGKKLNAEGLRKLSEVSLSVPSPVLRELAAFLLEYADEVDGANINWHRHAPEQLATNLGCDVIICGHPGENTV